MGDPLHPRTKSAQMFFTLQGEPMSGPSKSDREILDSRLKSRQLWGELFGWLVRGGLVVEYWEEIGDCFARWHWPSLSLVGGVLVTAGVFGEVFFSRLVLRTSDELQERADSDVARANARAAEAVERAAHADQAAAEANLERAKLEQRFAWRRILPEKKSEIGLSLSQFAGQKASIHFVTEPEVESFTRQLAALLKSANWDVVFGTPASISGLRTGVTVGSTPDERSLNAASAQQYHPLLFDWRGRRARDP